MSGPIALDASRAPVRLSEKLTTAVIRF